MSIKSFAAKIFAKVVKHQLNSWAKKPVETQQKIVSGSSLETMQKQYRNSAKIQFPRLAPVRLGVDARGPRTQHWDADQPQP